MSAEARMEGYSKSGHFRGRVLLIAERGKRLRIEAWTPTDQLVATLVADKDGFMFFDVARSECILGRACEENLQGFLPAGLKVQDSASALFGIPVLFAPEGGFSIAFDRKVGAYLLKSRVEGGGVQKVWITEDGKPLKTEVSQNGKLFYRMETTWMEDGSFPKTIAIHVPRTKSDLFIRYKNVDVSYEPSDEDFEKVCPDGMKIFEALCKDEGSL
jgi:outer membrane lipoprotein-sorting protein